MKLPEKSVRIPHFQQGKFLIKGGIYWKHLTLQLSFGRD